jgi:hypothetical protein
LTLIVAAATVAAASTAWDVTTATAIVEIVSTVVAFAHLPTLCVFSVLITWVTKDVVVS